MGSMKKFSKVTEFLEEKMDSLRKVMSLVIVEREEFEDQSRMIQDLFRGGSGEMESKEKDLKAIQESVNQCCEKFDSKRRSVDEGLKKLDEKEKFLKDVLREIEVEKMEFGKMRDSLDEQLKHVVLKEQQFQSLFGDLKLIENRLEKRENELDSLEKSLKRREDEICSKEKNLDEREHDIDAKDKELDRRLHILDSNVKILASRENEVDSKQKMLDTRNLEIESKVRLLEERENVTDRREIELHKKEESLVKDQELRKQISDLKIKLGIQELGSGCPTKSPEVRRKGSKRCENSVLIFEGICDTNEGKNKKDNSSKHAKRSCSQDRFSGQMKAHDHLQKSGSYDKSQAQTYEDIVVFDDSESDSDKMGNLVTKSTGESSSFSNGKRGKLTRNFNLGETWACFDEKDHLPRSYAQIINIIEKCGKVQIEVAWFQAFPVYVGEEEWVDAGLPVTCGIFKPSRTSVESPSILSHITFCAGGYPSKIFPYEGETWAIYKDWDIHAWASHPEFHRHCKYEIVEILNYPQTGPPSLGVRVAYLDKIMGSVNSFKRRTKSEEKSFLIKLSFLYRFSHKIPSIQKTCADKNGNLGCIFELDLKSLPLGRH